MCSHRYGDSKAILKIKAEKYKFSSFYDDVLTKELNRINKCIDTKEKSVAFHNLIIANKSGLTDSQKEVMKGAKLYLYGSNDACDTSEGHKILSAKARELFGKGLVEFADLDIIDPDYKPEANVDYWEGRLGNSKFTVADFTKWLDENINAFINTISNKDLNVSFWRWVKDNISDATLEKMPKLPVFLMDDSTADVGDVIYLSDAYISDGGIETIVKNYHGDASFISPDYLEENTDVEAWKNFWTKVGMLSDIVDILVNTIIPRLNEIDDEKLPATLVKYRKKLEDKFEDLPNELSALRVKAHDGNFYPISETIYVNSEKEEPFKYIELPNQISFETADERKLIKEIIDSIDGCCLEKLQEWQKAKIEQYLEIQNKEDSMDTLLSIHFQFIDELASMYTVDRESLNDFENLKDILLLDKDDDFCDASSLTLGSLYHPFCDFEKYGIDMPYLSDAYEKECKNDIRKMLNREFKVHSDFKKSDIKYLAKRDFSIYFWTEYLKKKDAVASGVKSLMEDGEFNGTPCIPTKDFMKKPSEVYSINITSYVKNNVEDWENKLPLNSIPKDESLFGLLDFKASLDFLDALYALFKIADSVRRKNIVTWMVDQYDEKYDTQIDAYREDVSATWFNTKNELVHVKKLYALEDGSKMLEQYFGNLPQIINADYLPDGDKFKKACEILKIKIIKSDELIVEPIGKDDTNNVVKKDLLIYALIIAGSEDSECWSDRYANYKKKIEELDFWRCTAISLCYNEDEEICQRLKKFYHNEDTTEFYYVKSLNDKRVFKPFVENFVDYLGVEAEIDFVEAVMDDIDSAIDIVKDNNRLMLNDDFKEELNQLVPGIKRELNGNKADEGDVEEGKYTRHTFSTYQRSITENNKEVTSEDKIGSNVEDGKREINTTSQEQQMQSPSKGDNAITSNHNSYIDYVKNNDSEGYSTIEQNDEEEVEEETDFCKTKELSTEQSSLTSSQRNTEPQKPTHEFDPDWGDYIGSVDKDNDYQRIGNRPWKSGTRKHPKNYTKEDVERLRSHGTPLELESLPATKEELDLLSQCNIKPEQIADTNYLAQLRLYLNLVNVQHEQPEETMEEFVRNADDVTVHKLKGDGNRYIHSCSAARGVMYVSPSVWNKMIDDKWKICVYLGGQGKNFHYIDDAEEFLKLVEKDDVVIKITGKEKVEVVKALYTGMLENVKGTAYTLIRVAARTNMDAVFAHYVGSMAEPDDGDDEIDINEYD